MPIHRYFFCVDLDVTESSDDDSGKKQRTFGAPLCPCRYYDKRKREISLAYWNCPCVPMREGRNVSMLFF
jgi:ferredoxin-thioredoxin reductase catalytic chain